MSDISNAIGVAQRTSADLATDIAYAQREAARPGGTATVRMELEAIAASVETINRTLTRLREQCE